MGYHREARIYKIVFADEEFDGLEIRARSVPIGKLRAVLTMDTSTNAATQAADDAMMALFVESLVSWNLEDDDGRPVPADLAGVDTQDADFVKSIIEAWMATVTGNLEGGDPLAGRSSGGAPSPEASIPMEPLSESPPNLRTLSG